MHPLIVLSIFKPNLCIFFLLSHCVSRTGRRSRCVPRARRVPRSIRVPRAGRLPRAVRIPRAGRLPRTGRVPRSGGRHVILQRQHLASGGGQRPGLRSGPSGVLPPSLIGLHVIREESKLIYNITK